MAIAYDTTSNGADDSSSPLTFSHTCTGSDLLLVVSVLVYDNSGSPNCSGVTYNGVALHLVGSKRAQALRQTSLWFLLGPSTGSNTVSVTFTGVGTFECNASASSYTGVKQTALPDATNGGTGTSTTPSTTVTTVADNCWVVGGGCFEYNPTVSLTQRSEDPLTDWDYYRNYQDTNGPKTPAGGQAVGWTQSIGQYEIQAASFAPATTTSVTKYPSANDGGWDANEANGYIDDGVYATTAPGTNSTESVEYGNFGFDALIPAGATINSVVITAKWKVSTTSSTATFRCDALVSNVAVGTQSVDTAEPTSDKITSYTNDYASWTRDKLLDGVFEVKISAQRGAGTTGYTMSLDYVNVTVDYTASSGAAANVSWRNLLGVGQ